MQKQRSVFSGFSCAASDDVILTAVAYIIQAFWRVGVHQEGHHLQGCLRLSCDGPITSRIKLELGICLLFCFLYSEQAIILEDVVTLVLADLAPSRIICFSM